MKELTKQGEHGILRLVMATHAGNTTDEFEAIENGWTVIDMKNDWKVIYPFELKEPEH